MRTLATTYPLQPAEQRRLVIPFSRKHCFGTPRNFHKQQYSPVWPDRCLIYLSLGGTTKGPQADSKWAVLRMFAPILVSQSGLEGTRGDCASDVNVL